MPNFVRVASISDLNPGENKIVFIEDEEIALFNIDGEFFAISNSCPHRGGPLGDGTLEGDIITCPLHGWRFNVKSGMNEVMPNVKVQCYQVKIEGNDILVSLD